jgi:RNA polymerase sporulation-specific sigma factor
MYPNSHLRPLPEDENNALLLKAKNGDHEAKDLFFRHNYRLMIYIAKKFENTQLSDEDRISAAQLGFLKAFNTFDPDKGIKFATYFTRCMENEILMLIRKNKPGLLVSLDDLLSVDADGNEFVLADVLESPEIERFGDFENKQMLYDILKEYAKKGSKRNLEIIRLRIIEEKAQKEVAEMFGLSQSYVSRVERRVLNQLRKIGNKMLGERKDDMSREISDKVKAQLKYCFEYTNMSSKAIEDLLNLSYPTVRRYRERYEAGKMRSIEADMETDKLIPPNVVRKYKLQEQPNSQPALQPAVQPEPSEPPKTQEQPKASEPKQEPSVLEQPLDKLWVTEVSMTFRDVPTNDIESCFIQFMKMLKANGIYTISFSAEKAGA